MVQLRNVFFYVCLLSLLLTASSLRALIPLFRHKPQPRPFLPSDTPTSEAVLGASLNPQNIREGDDVYFECHVRANPRAYKVVWKHNVSNETCEHSPFTECQEGLFPLFYNIKLNGYLFSVFNNYLFKFLYVIPKEMKLIL